MHAPCNVSGALSLGTISPCLSISTTTPPENRKTPISVGMRREVAAETLAVIVNQFRHTPPQIHFETVKNPFSKKDPFFAWRWSNQWMNSLKITTKSLTDLPPAPAFGDSDRDLLVSKLLIPPQSSRVEQAPGH